jgi:hypothetical protein
MSEPANESTGSSDEPGEDRETPDVGLIPDEDLPEDLQPEKNPLARDPGDDSQDSDDSAPGGPDETKVEGMPDMGA